MAAEHMFRVMTMENKLWVTPRPERSTQEDHHGRYVIFHHHYLPFLLSPKQEIVLAQIPGASQCNEACTVRVHVCVHTKWVRTQGLHAFRSASCLRLLCRHTHGHTHTGL